MHEFTVKPVKMARCFVIILLIMGKCCLLAAQQDSQPYCFRFTWVGPLHDRESAAKVNCTELRDAGNPCIEPKVITGNSSLPDTTLLWEEYKDNYNTIACNMKPGSVCLKYTYTFNNAILNITYFCGKMIEDKTSALSSGCYAQKVDGHIIEACACRSRPGRVPCNLSMRNVSSPIVTLLGILIFLYNVV